MGQAITVEKIKELRERTNVGMAKCKQALVDAEGDLELAVQNLRKAGLASASKKADREAKEGAVVQGESDSCVALVEINAETDFVVRNELFQEFAKNIAEELAKQSPSDLESFMQQKYSKDTSVTLDEYRATVIQSIGENIQVTRFACFPKSDKSSIGVYSHMGGKIVALVDLSGSGEQQTVARELAMHAAASRPAYLNQESVPQDIVGKEREIALAQVNEQEKLKNKPEEVKNKIIEGKIRAFCDENCFLDQKYVKNDKLTVQQFLEQESKSGGGSLNISSFTIWEVGGAA